LRISAVICALVKASRARCKKCSFSLMIIHP
jgi:hypothetical protein